MNQIYFQNKELEAERMKGLDTRTKEERLYKNEKKIEKAAKFILKLWSEGKSAFYETDGYMVSEYPFRNSETAFYVSEGCISGIKDEQKQLETVMWRIGINIDQTIDQQRSLIEKYRSLKV